MLASFCNYGHSPWPDRLPNLRPFGWPAHFRAAYALRPRELYRLDARAGIEKRSSNAYFSGAASSK
jgi:hypothetical protein